MKNRLCFFQLVVAEHAFCIDVSTFDRDRNCHMKQEGWPELVPTLLPMLDSQGVVAHGSLATFILVCEDHSDAFCKQNHVSTRVCEFMHTCVLVFVCSKHGGAFASMDIL